MQFQKFKAYSGQFIRSVYSKFKFFKPDSKPKDAFHDTESAFFFLFCPLLSVYVFFFFSI